MSKAIDISGLEAHVKMRRDSRAKRMALRLDPANRCVHFVLPRFASHKKAQAFIDSHRQWVIDRIRELPEYMPFEDGVNIPVLGRDVEIVVEKDPSRKSTHIELQDHILLVQTNLDDYAPRIKRFLKKVAREYLTDIMDEKTANLDRKAIKIQIRDTKSRWGSCSVDGHISLSWRLIFAPSEAMDYVVAHEAAHLMHMDHSKRFWALCEDLCIDYDGGKSWMREHGHGLHRYG